VFIKKHQCESNSWPLANPDLSLLRRAIIPHESQSKQGSPHESSVQDHLGRSSEATAELLFGRRSVGNKLFLRSVGFGMDVPFHLTCPFEKAPEIVAFPPHESPKLQEADLRHLDSAIGLDAPQEVRTSPRRQPVAFGRVPEKTDRVAHDDVTRTP
jgi:hypothetical protein